MKPPFFFFGMIALYLQAVAGLEPRKEMLQKIQGLWVEEKYMECVLSKKSPHLCAHNAHLGNIAIYIPPQSGSSDTLRFDISGLHTHDMLQNEVSEEEIWSYYNHSKMPDQIPSQRYPTDAITYFSDSTHVSYIQFTVVGKDTLLTIARDSIDAEWGGGTMVYKKYHGEEVVALLRSSGVHLFLNYSVRGKYEVLSSKGKPLQKWIELCLDGSLKSNVRIFQNKRYQIGTEFYCMPHPPMSYVLFIDLTASRQHIKSTKEWITLCKRHEYGYEFKGEKIYLYEIKGDFNFFKKKLKYILMPVQ